MRANVTREGRNRGKGGSYLDPVEAQRLAQIPATLSSSTNLHDCIKRRTSMFRGLPKLLWHERSQGRYARRWRTTQRAHVREYDR